MNRNRRRTCETGLGKITNEITVSLVFSRCTIGDSFS